MRANFSSSREHLTPLLRSGNAVLTIALAQSIWDVSHEKARRIFLDLKDNNPF
ncbi:MAG TPA: hypothetical protein PLY23_01780 [Alphaproteobacteria bacterium]|nr:hypothetical protein [Alphaproteobacteria bacterium]HQS93370.1 hypothetical protein [Alphaproteobacteria bacterium]